MHLYFQLPIGNEALELEVTLPGEGRDRVFRVNIKWVEQVSHQKTSRLKKTGSFGTNWSVNKAMSFDTASTFGTNQSVWIKKSYVFFRFDSREFQVFLLFYLRYSLSLCYFWWCESIINIIFVSFLQVSLYALEEALEGRIRQIPFNAIQALDVVMRHLVNAFTIIFYLRFKSSLL